MHLPLPLFDIETYIKILWNFTRGGALSLMSYCIVLHLYLITVPFKLLQKLITVIVKLYDKDVTKIVTGLEAFFHRDFDTFVTEKSLHTIVTCCRIKGQLLSESQLQEIFRERIIQRKDKEGSLVFPELQQYFVRFLCYSFLKWDREFDIQNHISVHNCERSVVVTRPVLTEMWENFMTKPFSGDRSPWEVLIVENYVADADESNPSEWIILIRWYQGLGSKLNFDHILTLFETDSTIEASRIPTTDYNNVLSDVQNLAQGIRCILLGPYDLINHTILCGEKFHSFHFPAHELSKQYFVVECPLISVRNVTHLKQRFGVTFTIILAEIVCGGLRKFLMKNEIPFPELWTVGVPLLADTNDKCDCFLVPVALPIAVPEQKDRFRIIQDNLQSLRNHSVKIMLNFIIGRISYLPSFVMRALTRKSVFSTSCSIIRCPEPKLRGLQGCELVEANFTQGLSSDSLGMGITSVMYNGKLRLTLFIDRNLVNDKREKAVEIAQCFVEEYLELKKNA